MPTTRIFIRGVPEDEKVWREICQPHQECDTSDIAFRPQRMGRTFSGVIATVPESDVERLLAQHGSVVAGKRIRLKRLPDAPLGPSSIANSNGKTNPKADAADRGQKRCRSSGGSEDEGQATTAPAPKKRRREKKVDIFVGNIPTTADTGDVAAALSTALAGITRRGSVKGHAAPSISASAVRLLPPSTGAGVAATPGQVSNGCAFVSVAPTVAELFLDGTAVGVGASPAKALPVLDGRQLRIERRAASRAELPGIGAAHAAAVFVGNVPFNTPVSEVVAAVNAYLAGYVAYCFAKRTAVTQISDAALAAPTAVADEEGAEGAATGDGSDVEGPDRAVDASGSGSRHRHRHKLRLRARAAAEEAGRKAAECDGEASTAGWRVVSVRVLRAAGSTGGPAGGADDDNFPAFSHGDKGAAVGMDSSDETVAGGALIVTVGAAAAVPALCAASNQLRLGRRPLRIDLSARKDIRASGMDPANAGSGAQTSSGVNDTLPHTVVVSGLPKGTTEPEIRQLMGSCGPILWVKWVSAGAVVAFAVGTSVRAAVGMDGRTLNNRKLRVVPAVITQ
eukprot:TRINITY_DN24731_c0_g1_i1.p1 TRINITY_DN24731_c0_g1~~TRINITY_DN24731_c0_g1_i1.p1  ORF type:complete len:566 (+),score=85.63 TRINITY_DN24731_c0_g1_i1:86-1783(+)